MLMRETDVLIVGSGFGAAAPALRLARAGLKVTIVEKGPSINPWLDFKQTQDPAYLTRYLKSMGGENLSLTYAEALGGGSGFYEMVSLRAPSTAFHLVDTSGLSLWPAGIDRAALDPWYDIADEMLHVEQIAPELVPKSGLVFARMMKTLGYSCERARYAVQGCQGSGYCVTGCIYGAKQSLLITYLPQAVEAGAVIDTDLDAVQVRSLPVPADSAHGGAIAAVPYRYEVDCTHRSTGESRVYRARVVILAGGTVGTARLLLASRPTLPGLSDHVGRNIAFNGGVKSAGMLPENAAEADMFVGRSHPGMISYEFLASRGITISAAKPMPIQVVMAARMRLEGDRRENAWWGSPNAELMRQMRTRMMVMFALGMTPPMGRLVPRGGGRLDVELPVTAELRRYHDETLELLHSIMRRNGCRVIQADLIHGDGQLTPEVYFSSTHHTGSARMADSKSRGVVDAAGEAFDLPGLYVSDGAAIPSSLAVNTSLTILANAERIAAGIARRYTPSTVLAGAT